MSGIFFQIISILNMIKIKSFIAWNHEPLVSGSIKYPGSFYKHKANIYKIDLPDIHSKFITIKNITEP